MIRRFTSKAVTGAGAPRLSAAGAGTRGLKHFHRGSGSSGSLRAAVFGINDGLVSNLSLVLGVAGADLGNRAVLLSGLAGLVAGAFSMGTGEYVSMKAQRELFEQQIAREQHELRTDPRGERDELTAIYQAKGLPHAEAEALANRLIANPDVALDTMAREELGLNPDELGSPVGAALSSFAMFTVGAVLPVLPFMFGGGVTAIIVSVALSILALATVGFALAQLSDRHPVRGIARMVGFGAAAAAATYLVGWALGVSVSG